MLGNPGFVRAPVRRGRRGNYSMLSALMIFVMIGFGAISVDLSLVRLAASQAQDVADAASQAAIVVYRLSRVGGYTDEQARLEGGDAARYVIAKNTIVGASGTLGAISWGTWNPRAAPGTEFTATAAGGATTAVQLSLSRSGTQAIDLAFGKVLGRNAIPVAGSATSATRNVQVELALDITGSWDKDEFQYARQAAVAFFDILAANHGPDDRFGAYVWWANYAMEYVPTMKVDDAIANPALARNLLASLNVGNYSGIPESTWEPPSATSKHVACKVYGTAGDGVGSTANGIFAPSSTTYFNSIKNRWSDTVPAVPTSGASFAGRGCHPTMPRYYQAEGGTDHHTGLMLGRTIMNQQRYFIPGSGWTTGSDPLAFRAIIVLTDGLPSNISAPGSLRTGISGSGNTSTSAVPSGYSWSFADSTYPEPWQATYGIDLREYRRDTAHTVANIKTDTQSLAANMDTTDDISIWFVSFRENDTFMANSSVGEGYYSYVPSSDVSSLVPTFEEIARSLPTSIVK